jgi:hypothetical protein
MNHGVFMRELHCRAHLLKKGENLIDARFLLSTITIDRHSVDVFHYEIWQSFVSPARVDKLRDIGMFKIREYLSLFMKSPHDNFVFTFAMQDL